MKHLILIALIVSGCATVRDPNGPDAQESRRRVAAMLAAGQDPFSSMDVYEAQQAEGRARMNQGAMYLGEKWGSQNTQMVPSQAPTCRLVPVENPVTHQYDLVKKCGN